MWTMEKMTWAMPVPLNNISVNRFKEMQNKSSMETCDAYVSQQTGPILIRIGLLSVRRQAMSSTNADLLNFIQEINSGVWLTMKKILYQNVFGFVYRQNLGHSNF